MGAELAVVMRERFPVTVPGADAEKATEKVLVAPAATVAGRVRSEVVKPVPVSLAWLIETAVVPVFVAETVCAPGVPTMVETETAPGETFS
jgi:hypothetical protein